MASTTLTPDILTALQKRLTVQASPLATSVCRIYAPSPSKDKWVYTGIFGVVALVFDRSVDPARKSIRVYEYPNLGKLRFEVELPYDATYEAENEFFHTLEVDDVVLGFCFALGPEKPIAVDDKNKTITSEPKRFLKAVQSNKPTLEELAEAERRQAEEEKKRRPSGWGGTLRSIFGAKPKSAEVSKPTDFIHKAHVGMGQDGSFDMKDIPAEWVEILKAAGVKKKDFQNPEKAKVILNTMSAFKDQVKPAGAAAAAGGGQASAKAGSGAAAASDASTANESSDGGPPGALRRARSTSEQDAGKRFMAKHPFTAKPDSKQLTVAKGETFVVITTFKNGWIKVECDDGRVGLVPANFCVEVGGTGGAAVGSSPGPGNVVKKAAKPVVTTHTDNTADSPSGGKKKAPSPSNKNSAAAAAAAVPPTKEEGNDESDGNTTTSARPPALNFLADIKKPYKLDPVKPAADESTPSRPSGNPLLDGIKGFKSSELKPAGDAVAEKKPAAPNILDSIKSGAVTLKKVQIEPRPPPKLDEDSQNIASILAAKMSKIRHDIGEPEEDDGDNDWDDD